MTPDFEIQSMNTAVLERIRSRHRRAQDALAVHAENTLKGLLSNTDSSAPGDPPAMRTGQLREASYAMAKHAPESSTTRVGNSAEHAAYLENGTMEMAPRPFMRPHMSQMRQHALKIVAQKMA